jgi:hypothetical protein
MIYTYLAISLLILIVLRVVRTHFEYSYRTPIVGEDGSQEFDSPYPGLISRAFLLSFLKPKKSDWITKVSGPDKWKLLVIQGAIKFLWFFFLASLIFSLLQLWLDTATYVDNAKATILEIERAQFQIKEYLGFFKLGLGYEFLLLFLLIALAAQFPFLERLNISGKLKPVTKVVKAAVYFLAFTTSFTFFGNAFAANEEGRVGELEFHKLEIVRGNKLLLKKIKDDVAEKVVQKALKDLEVDSTSAKLAEIKRNIAAAKEEEEYKGFVAIAPANAVGSLRVSKFEKDYYTRYGSPNNPNSPPSNPKPPPNNPNPPSDPPPDGPQSPSDTSHRPEVVQQDKDFSDFQEKNRQWYDEKQFSMDSVREAETVYEKATQTDEPLDSLYEKYKEPINKAIKKGYGATGGKLIKNVLEVLGLDFMFVDEFLNPVLNEPIERYITEKAEKIFKGSVDNNVELVNSEYKSAPAEVRQIMDRTNVRQANSTFNKELDSQVAASSKLSAATQAEIAAHDASAASHLKKMELSSRWEGIRASFSGRLRNPLDLSELGSEARPVYRRFLSEWSDFKKNQKLSWYLNSKTNLEEQFFEFTKGYAAGKACWGFILQQQDWDGAVTYFTVTRPENATGKPYYLLKYYYGSTGKLSMLDSLYDSETNNAVGLLCPH